MSDLCPVAVSHDDSLEDDFQPGTIGESLVLLLLQKKNCDVTFTFPSRPDKIEAHEFILKARSPVFAKIFRLRKSGNVQGKEIQISECTLERFQQFLEFVYADIFDVNIAGALDLLQLSQKYRVKPLAKKCEELLKTKIQIEDSVKVFEAARRYDRQELMDRAGQIMVKSFLKFIETDALLHAEENTLVYLLERDDLSVEEVKLFQVILDWGRSQVGAHGDDQKLKDKLKNLISKIRYTNMTLKDFTKVVVPTGLLSSEECLSVYSYFGGDEVTSAQCSATSNLKFNTTRRKVGKEEKFVDFFSKEEHPKRWAPAFTEQRLLFKVERSQGSGSSKKTAVISRIKFQWPRIHNKYRLEDIPDFNVIIREYTGPVVSRNSKVKFRKDFTNCKEGIRDDIAVNPPVELICGRTYSVIVEDDSMLLNLEHKFFNDARAYYGDVYSKRNRKASGDILDNGHLGLKDIHVKTEYFSDKFSDWDFYFAVIKGVTIELV